MKNIVLVNGLRVFKPSGAISAVLREQKTERAMKAIMLLNGMRQKFSMGGNGGESCDNLSAEDLMKDITPQQLKEIGSSFDAFDTSGDGNIDSGEFLQLMQSLGIKLSEEEAEEKLKILDEDNDGTVSRLSLLGGTSNRSPGAPENQRLKSSWISSLSFSIPVEMKTTAPLTPPARRARFAM